MGEEAPVLRGDDELAGRLFDGIEDLADLLRREGHQVNFAEILRLRSLVFSLATSRALKLTAPGFASQVGPALCRNADEQKRLPGLVAKWFRGIEGSARTVAERPAVRPSPQGDERSWRPSRLAVLFSISVLLTIFWLAVSLWPQPHTPPAIGTPPAGTGEVVEDPGPGAPAPSRPGAVVDGGQPAPSIDNEEVDDAATTDDLFGWLAASGSLVSFVLGLLWWRRTRSPVLRRGSGQEVGTDRSRLFVKLRKPGLFSSRAVDRWSSQLRRREVTPLYDLDVERTVELTARQAGAVSAVARPVRRTRAVVAVVEQRAVRDHYAGFITEMLGELRASGVPVELWFFQGSPVRARASDGRSIDVEVLMKARAAERFWLFCSPELLISPVSGTPLSFLSREPPSTDSRILVPDAVWCSTLPAREMRELGWTVATVDPARLTSSVRSDLPSGALAPSSAAPPSIVAGRSREWLAPTEPATSLLEDGLRQVRDYLGAEGTEWLQATAAYPELRWELTLHLGATLHTTRDRESPGQLFLLSKLPWFRAGFLPDWLRRRLLDDVSGEREGAIRQELREVLGQGLEDPAGSESFPVVGRRSGSGEPGASMRVPKVRHDQVLVDFVQNRLALRLPRQVARWWRRQRRSGLRPMGQRAVLALRRVRAKAIVRDAATLAMLLVLGARGSWSGEDSNVVRPVDQIFVVADALEGQGRLVDAIVEVERIRQGAFGLRRDVDRRIVERLARYHAAVGDRHFAKREFGLALDHYEKSYREDKVEAVSNSITQCLAEIGDQLNAALVRAEPDGPVFDGKPAKFSGELKSPLVKYLRIDGRLMPLRSGQFSRAIPITGKTSLPVEVTLRGDQSVRLADWPIAIEVVPPERTALAVPPSIVIDGDKPYSLQVRSEPGATVTVNGQSHVFGPAQSVHEFLVRSADDKAAPIEVTALAEGKALTKKTIAVSRVSAAPTLVEIGGYAVLPGSPQNAGGWPREVRHESTGHVLVAFPWLPAEKSRPTYVSRACVTGAEFGTGGADPVYVSYDDAVRWAARHGFALVSEQLWRSVAAAGRTGPMKASVWVDDGVVNRQMPFYRINGTRGQWSVHQAVPPAARQPGIGFRVTIKSIRRSDKVVPENKPPSHGPVEFRSDYQMRTWLRTADGQLASRSRMTLTPDGRPRRIRVPVGERLLVEPREDQRLQNPAEFKKCVADLRHPAVWGLILGRSHVPVRPVGLLVDLPDLEHLELVQLYVSAPDAAVLGKLTGLRHLTIRDGVFVDAAAAELEPLVDLVSLRLIGPRFRAAGFEALAKLVNLEELRLERVASRPEWVAELAGMTSLRKLELVQIRLHPKHLTFLKALRSLEELRIERCAVTTEQLRQLGLQPKVLEVR